MKARAFNSRNREVAIHCSFSLAENEQSSLVARYGKAALDRVEHCALAQPKRRKWARNFAEEIFDRHPKLY